MDDETLEPVATIDEAATLDPRFGVLPTGKQHVSFSEMRDWQDCSFRHKLKFVDKVPTIDVGVHADFGTACHAACEHFMRTRVMDLKIFKTTFYELWKEHAPNLPEEYTVEAFKQFAQEGLALLPEVPSWLDETFPGWAYVDAEHLLYEPIPGRQYAFKGYIDAIITCPGPRGKLLTWLIDFKTCGWGWKSEKKSDPNVCAQLVNYKNFWSTKTGTDPKDVRCAFVLLKRNAKPGKHCEMVTTSAGEVTTNRALKVINNMVVSVERGIAIKNRANCTWCKFYNTPHCT
jgi:hypothetical protein